VYSNQELAVRLHHQMIFIHHFPNGNGRHARLLADLVMMNLGEPRFTWGVVKRLPRLGMLGVYTLMLCAKLIVGILRHC
jgi:fido (protein-threonine AMPylation protein)